MKEKSYKLQAPSPKLDSLSPRDDRMKLMKGYKKETSKTGEENPGHPWLEEIKDMPIVRTSERFGLLYNKV